MQELVWQFFDLLCIIVSDIVLLPSYYFPLSPPPSSSIPSLLPLLSPPLLLFPPLLSPSPLPSSSSLRNPQQAGACSQTLISNALSRVQPQGPSPAGRGVLQWTTWPL